MTDTADLAPEAVVGRHPSEPCSDSARRRADPLVATAPPTHRWLLLEVPTAWSEKVLNSRDIRGATKALAAVVERRHGRVLFVRRPGRPDENLPALAGAGSATGERGWVVVDAASATETGGTWAPSGPERPEAELAEAISAFDRDAPFEAPASTRLLVCTHGTHDQCCAVRGRPVATALAERWPNEVWECSHLGGDRFAGNLIVLPDGTYLGGLDADNAVALTAEQLHGHTPVENLRGVATQAPVVQAAVTEVLRTVGPYAAHRLHGHVTDHPDGQRWIVDVTGHPATPHTAVVVDRVVLPPADRACLAGIAKVAVTYRARVLSRTGSAGPGIVKP